MSECVLKYENNAKLKENSNQKLLIAFKMAYSCCFGLRRYLDFTDFLQKKLNKINYRI